MADISGAPSAPIEDDGPFSAFEAEALGLVSSDDKVSPPDADPAPAEPVEQAASTDATSKPASEPGKPKKNAETRIPELLADRDRYRTEAERERAETVRLRAELEHLRRPAPDAKPAESSPAKPTPKEFERFKAMPDAPQLNQYDDYSDWSIAMSVFAADKRYEERSQQQFHQVQEQRIGQAKASLVTKGSQAFQDFKEVLSAAEAAGLRWPPQIAELVLTHERGHEIAYHLASQRIADPIRAGMAIAALLNQQANPDPIQKQQPKAPPPPMTLGTKPNDKGNSMRAAISNDDYSAFEAELLAQMRAERA